VVSDDEVEVKLLNINSFMNLAVNPTENPPTTSLLSGMVDQSNPANGDNMAVPIEAAPMVSIQDSSDFIWQRNVVGNVDPASTAGISITKFQESTFMLSAPYIALMKSQKTSTTLT